MSAARSSVGDEAAEPVPPPIAEAPPALDGRSLLCLLGIVAAADVAIYRGEGFAGYAALFGLLPLLLYFGIAPRRADRSVWVVTPLLLVLAGRLVWCGNWLAVAVGFSLLAALAMALAGLRPYVLEAVVFLSQTVPAGFYALRRRPQRADANAEPADAVPGPVWSAIFIPAAVVLIFGAIFVLANPDLVTWFSTELSRVIRRAREWLFDFAPEPLEVLFWVAAAWIGAGLLRPLIPAAAAPAERAEATELVWPEEAPLYAAFRNTLLGVVGLFAIYLAFEFATLWFRKFPKGFHYSGYAHGGAAWLTVALALATGLLSLMFQGRTLRDPRLPLLRRFAAIWAAENLLLALAVYNRLYIYVGFNGMTRMRVVGLLGITAVVIGFILVLIKIRKNHNFMWLIRRHLWTLAGAFYLYAVLPVDVIAMSYNVRRIMNGDPAPSVQISVHPIRDEGLLVLSPLLESEDILIREGVRAMLAGRLKNLERQSRSSEWHWTEHQIATEVLESQLRSNRGELAVYGDRAKREAAERAFDEYAYQWY